MIKVIFLDRDGVINIDKGYVYKTENLIFTHYLIEGLKLLQTFGYLFVIITNQSGIGRGIYSESDFLSFQLYLEKKLLKEGIKISNTFYCKHHPKNNCLCRKPLTGMVKEYLKNNNIDYDLSYVIGDQLSDLKFGSNLGLKSILINQNEENNSIFKDEKFQVVDNLLEAAKLIIKNE